MHLILELFITFAKIGLFTFGGGYAMISLIESTCVDRKQWITHEEMMDMTIIAESTPGPIAINCATYVGCKQAGLAGALVATLGMVLPAFLVIYPISRFFDNFLEIAVIANAFRGIKIAVGFLILNAALTMLKKMAPRPLPRTIMLCAFLVMMAVNFFSLRISTITLMIVAALVGLGTFLVKGGGRK